MALLARTFSLLSVLTLAAAQASDLSSTPIATPTADSSTFQRVNEAICDTTSVTKVTKIYTKNRSLFDQCVIDGDYQIFPHTGTYPTSAQLRQLVSSPACTAIFTAVLLAEIPACDLGGTPLRSASETLLTLKVDIVDEGNKPPTSARFKEMVLWREAVNLAQVAGLPFDGQSLLYAQYTRNLWTALTKTSVQVFLDYSIAFILPNGTLSRGTPETLRMERGGSDSGCGSGSQYLDEMNDIAASVNARTPVPSPTSQTAFVQQSEIVPAASEEATSTQVASHAAATSESMSMMVVALVAFMSL